MKFMMMKKSSTFKTTKMMTIIMMKTKLKLKKRNQSPNKNDLD